MNISGTQNRKYPYGSDCRVSETGKLYRFMDIDLTEFLGKIAEKVVLLNKKDWKYDKQMLEEAAMSEDPDDRRLIWLVSAHGTRLSTERETFIEDTPACRYMTEYRQYPPDLFGYVIEVSGIDNGIVRGNAYDIGDVSEYAWYVRKTAMPLESVTLTYSEEWGDFAGQTVDVPHYEFSRDKKMYVSEKGYVEDIAYHPLGHDMRSMPSLLHQERENRMKLAEGSAKAHLEKLFSKLADIRGETKLEPVQKPIKQPVQRKIRKPAQKPIRKPIRTPIRPPMRRPIIQVPPAMRQPSIASRLAVASMVMETYRPQTTTNKSINNERTI